MEHTCVSRREKLSDIEYTVKWDPGGGREIRIRTLDYMSIKIEALSYHHRLPRRPLDLSNIDGIVPTEPAPPFYYKPLHYLESMRWVAI